MASETAKGDKVRILVGSRAGEIGTVAYVAYEGKLVLDFEDGVTGLLYDHGEYESISESVNSVGVDDA